MPAADTEVSLYAHLRRSLVESGEWDQVLTVLRARLNDVGWVDDVLSAGKECSREMKFEAVLGQVNTRALASVPVAVRKEMIMLIRRCIEKKFE